MGRKTSAIRQFIDPSSNSIDAHLSSGKEPGQHRSDLPVFCPRRLIADQPVFIRRDAERNRAGVPAFAHVAQPAEALVSETSCCGCKSYHGHHFQSRDRQGVSQKAHTLPCAWCKSGSRYLSGDCRNRSERLLQSRREGAIPSSPSFPASARKSPAAFIRPAARERDPPLAPFSLP